MSAKNYLTFTQRYVPFLFLQIFGVKVSAEIAFLKQSIHTGLAVKHNTKLNVGDELLSLQLLSWKRTRQKLTDSVDSDVSTDGATTNTSRVVNKPIKSIPKKNRLL